MFLSINIPSLYWLSRDLAYSDWLSPYLIFLLCQGAIRRKIRLIEGNAKCPYPKKIDL